MKEQLAINEPKLAISGKEIIDKQIESLDKQKDEMLSSINEQNLKVEAAKVEAAKAYLS